MRSCIFLLLAVVMLTAGCGQRHRSAQGQLTEQEIEKAKAGEVTAAQEAYERQKAEIQANESMSPEAKALALKSLEAGYKSQQANIAGEAPAAGQQ